MRKLFESNKDISPPMFKNKFLDYFSRVQYWVPLALYIPVILVFGYLSFAYAQVTTLSAVLYMLLGVFLWTLAEYILHRWVFHYEPTTDLGKRIHFIVHGVHHDYPNDSKRLVMPPGISLPLAVIFFTAFYLPLGDAAYPAFTGFVAGYLFYDICHYMAHNVKVTNNYFKMIQKNHIRHHYDDPDKGYGFTSPLWDIVFKTEFDNKSPWKMK